MQRSPFVYMTFIKESSCHVGLMCVVIGYPSEHFGGEGGRMLSQQVRLDRVWRVVRVVGDAHHGYQCMATRTKTEVRCMRKSGQMGVLCTTHTQKH